MPHIQANGVRLFYQQTGDGPPLVLLMGWGGDHTAWALQVPAFAQEFRCITPDNRGAGRTDAPDAPYTIRMMADDTAALLDALGVERAHVAGISMGGMIAQELAIAHLERVLTLQLHATLARPDPFVRAVGETILRARTLFGREEYVRAMLPWVLAPRTYAERPELVALMVERLVEHPYPTTLTGMTRQAEACWGHDTADRLGGIRCPTLVTVGREDIFVGPRFSRELAERIPGAELQVIEAGGHGYLWERPEAFNESCLAFLRRHRSP